MFPILEPTTVVTDYLLALLGVVLGRRLWRGAAPDGASRRLWAGALFAMALAALAGGTSHGFVDRLGDTGNWVLWRVTVWSVGVAALLMASATARFAFTRRVGRFVIALFAVQFAVYAIWMIRHDGFEYVIAQYLPAMAFVGGTALWLWVRHGWAGGPWVVVGVLVSFGAAGVQASGLTLHTHFNHNDLYHVIQMAGFYLLYRGGALLDESAVGSEAPLDVRPAPRGG